MKKLVLILLVMVSGWAHAQIEVTINGDPSDSTVIKQKTTLEAKGFVVKIENLKEGEEPEPTGDVAFIKKYTGQNLPDFEYADLSGTTINSSALAGKKVHINFWSVTCKPCIEEFPELNELKEKYDDGQTVFIAFAPESKKKVERILSRFPLEYTIISNAEELYDQLGINGYPKNFFVNSDGVIKKVTDGTNYKGEVRNGELVMIPDNFPIYDKIMSSLE